MQRPKYSFLCTGLILQCLILVKCNTNVLAITTSPHGSNELSLRYFARSLTHCLSGHQTWKCLEAQFVQLLDAATQDNTTWHYGDFVTFEKRELDNAYNKNNASKGVAATMTSPAAHFLQRAQQRALSVDMDVGVDNRSIASRLLRLARSRSIRLQLPRTSIGTLRKLSRGFSDAIDSFAESAATATSALDPTADEGRKKKDKDKNMAMMGGMAMMAMVAQMFFGKVILIAGSAFVMAKIALLISVMGSRKGSIGSSGSTEHVYLTSGGHGHDSGSAGWHRSMPYDEFPKLPVISEPPIHHDEVHPHYAPPPQTANGHKQSYYNYEITEGEDEDVGESVPFRRREATAGFLRI